MVWHLPHIRAIAARFGDSVTLVAKPRSAADQILAADPAARDVMWVDRNPEGRRGRHDGPDGLVRLVAALRARRFGRAVLLHHSGTLAFALMAAGIAERFGYGARWQRPFLNRPPFLSARTLRLHPFDQATAWIAAAGMDVSETEPVLPVVPEARRVVRNRLEQFHLAHLSRAAGEVNGTHGLVVLGIGSSESYKQWGAPRFAALARALAGAGWRCIALAGGIGERSLAEAIAARCDESVPLLAAIGWPLGEVAALCAEAGFYVGNDTGVMNLAAAVGTSSFGLFGAVPPIRHARRIIAVMPPDGQPDKETGMARIDLPLVLRAIEAVRGDLAPDVADRAASSGLAE